MYLDSAYIAKSYLNEPDAPAVRALIRTADDRMTSELSVIEVASAFHRHLRQRELTQTQYQELLASFHRHLEGEVWALVPLSGRLIRRVSAAMGSVPAGVFLRSGDAIQLFSAIEAGESEIWSSDRHLLAAAPHFGLGGRSVRK